MGDATETGRRVSVALGCLYTMIGNGKFEPFTVWNDIELRYRITASQRIY